MSKKAIVVLSQELIAQLLNLPNGAVISGARQSFESGNIELRIDGYGPETAEGNAVYKIEPKQIDTEHGLVWDFDEWTSQP